MNDRKILMVKKVKNNVWKNMKTKIKTQGELKRIKQ